MWPRDGWGENLGAGFINTEEQDNLYSFVGNVVRCAWKMETRVESLSRFRTRWRGVLVGFVLSIFLQHELGPYFTPRLRTWPLLDSFPHDFSFPPSVEFGAFGVIFFNSLRGMPSQIQAFVVRNGSLRRN